MTAPDQCCSNVRKFLPRRRPHMTQSGHRRTLAGDDVNDPKRTKTGLKPRNAAVSCQRAILWAPVMRFGTIQFCPKHWRACLLRGEAAMVAHWEVVVCPA